VSLALKFTTVLSISQPCAMGLTVCFACVMCCGTLARKAYNDFSANEMFRIGKGAQTGPVMSPNDEVSYPPKEQSGRGGEIFDIYNTTALGKFKETEEWAECRELRTSVTKLKEVARWIAMSAMLSQGNGGIGMIAWAVATTAAAGRCEACGRQS